MNFKLEGASINDVPEINRIQKLAFKISYDKYEFCPAFETTNEQLATYLEKAFVYKIIYDEKIIGSVFIYKISDHHYELDTMSIHPEYQNAGIGNGVISLIENIYFDALLWSLSTPETDYRNRHFYEKIGYIQFDTEVINEDLTLIRYRKEAV